MGKMNLLEFARWFAPNTHARVAVHQIAAHDCNAPAYHKSSCRDEFGEILPAAQSYLALTRTDEIRTGQKTAAKARIVAAVGSMYQMRRAG